jgi:hypothetical protein
MLTSDLTTGELGWNTSVLDADTIREVRGKAPRQAKESLAEAFDLKAPKVRNSSADLDTLVATMERSQTLPSGGSDASSPSGSGVSARGAGARKTGSASYALKEKPHYTDKDKQFDKLMRKYKLKPQSPEGMMTAPASGTGAAPKPRVKRAYTRRKKA